MRVVALLRQGDTKSSGVNGDLSDKTVFAVRGLDRPRPFQRCKSRGPISLI
jgi:hypothetical protein